MLGDVVSYARLLLYAVYMLARRDVRSQTLWIEFVPFR